MKSDLHNLFKVIKNNITILAIDITSTAFTFIEFRYGWSSTYIKDKNMCFMWNTTLKDIFIAYKIEFY